MAGNRVDEVAEELKSGVLGLFESDRFREYLDTQSKFYNYSINNCVLISMQKPDASLVAGYTAWKTKFHRQVKRGEKGIDIIAPANTKKTIDVEVRGPDGKPVFNEDGSKVTEKQEVEYKSFRIAHVFDVSQTEGDPLPEIVTELKGPVEGYDEYLDAIRELAPVPIRFDEIRSGAKGYYSPSEKEIVIQRGMAEEQTIKTLLHECAHARLEHGSENDHWDRNTHEVQAESIAYCTCKYLGLDTADYSFGYIAGWSSGKEITELKQNLQLIKDETNAFIKQIEQTFENMKMREEAIAQQLQLEITPATITF